VTRRILLLPTSQFGSSLFSRPLVFLSPSFVRSTRGNSFSPVSWLQVPPRSFEVPFAVRVVFSVSTPSSSYLFSNCPPCSFFFFSALYLTFLCGPSPPLPPGRLLPRRPRFSGPLISRPYSGSQYPLVSAIHLFFFPSSLLFFFFFLIAFVPPPCPIISTVPASCAPNALADRRSSHCHRPPLPFPAPREPFFFFLCSYGSCFFAG